MKFTCTGLLVFLLCISVGYSQQSDSYQFTRYNSSRTVSLKPGKEITITFKPTLESNSRDSVVKSVVGLYASKQDSKLTVLVATEYSKYTYAPDSILETYRKYSYDYPVTYDAQSIAYISYAPKIRPAIEMATFASVLSLAVIAPLYAFNMKERNFNSDAYISVAAPAAIATLITVPLYYKIEERKIQFIHK